jgi:hypothetical protein
VKTTRFSSALALVILGLGGSALVGCTPDFDHLEIDLTTTPPLPVSVGPTNVALPVGVAVGVTATPFDTSGEKMDAAVVLALIPKNEDVIKVSPTIDERSFVLVGVGPGTTSITVEVDHQRRLDIPVTVKLQPTE